jgi:hypothetical protein
VKIRIQNQLDASLYMVENSSYMYGRVFCGLTALTAALRIYVGTHNMHKTTGTITQIDFATLWKPNTISTLKRVFAAWLYMVCGNVTQ